MAEVCVFAPAKINLHLEVLGLRPDGFHELAMVMQSLDLGDRLRLRSTADACLSLECEGADLPLGEDNLIVRAAGRLRQRAGLPELGAAITLEKRIPIGAGLAGGSSDAAATLVGLNTLWGLGFDSETLQELAADLGSDVPYCLVGGTQLCFGRGERLEPVRGEPVRGEPVRGEPLNLGVLLLKHPDVSVSTPWAYGRCRELRGDYYLQRELEFEERRQALRQGPLLAALRGEAPLPRLRNDLQAVVEPEVASVADGLALLRRSPGALAVAMSGSGPSLFALFADLEQAQAAQRALADDLTAAGFQSWCCRCRSSGASLESPETVR
jgi:4-diphosphocytidyl-2-C-methyl-D-erythritol kinase